MTSFRKLTDVVQAHLRAVKRVRLGAQNGLAAHHVAWSMTQQTAHTHTSIIFVCHGLPMVRFDPRRGQLDKHCVSRNWNPSGITPPRVSLYKNHTLHLSKHYAPTQIYVLHQIFHSLWYLEGQGTLAGCSGQEARSVEPQVDVTLAPSCGCGEIFLGGIPNVI